MLFCYNLPTDYHNYEGNMATNRLASNLQELMRIRKINPTALARETGIGQPVIYRIATGETDNPTLSTLHPIAKYFGVSINQLIGDEPIDQVHTSQRVRRIPIIDMVQASEWHHSPEAISPSGYVMIDTDISDKGFAITLKDSTMEPNFPEGTILIIDPLLNAKNQDYVIAYHQTQSLATFKQLLLDGNDIYLKPLNPEFKTIKATETHVIMGTMIQARLDFK